MVKTIDILGIRVNSSPVRELMHEVEGYLEEPAMNTIENITAGMILQCQENSYMQEVLNGLDMPLLGDEEILSAVGIDSPAKRQEIRNREFLHEFMRRLARNQKTIFVLGETKDETDRLVAYLQETYDKVKLVGTFAMEDCVGDTDGAINEMNGATPDVIFSLLQSPFQEEFLQTERLKLNAGIWFGVGKDYIRDTATDKIKGYVKHLIHRGRLHKSISEYDDEVESIHGKNQK